MYNDDEYKQEEAVEQTEGDKVIAAEDEPVLAEDADSKAESEGDRSAIKASAGENGVSEEELDRIADTAIAALRNILSFFNAGDAEIDEYEGDDGELILDIVGDNLAVLIGHYGKTLDALQFVVSAIVSKETGYRYPVVVDVEGYRNRRRQKLEGIARSSATRCIRSGAAVSLKPMTPYERRIVHIVLREDSRVLTESEGIEPNRYIIIKPA